MYSKKGRIARGDAPKCKLTKTTYRKALPELRRDFKDRCAYCMRKIATISEMEIDHFNPTKKNDKIQRYSNLFLADKHCNNFKDNTWPAVSLRRKGVRFLNCCKEVDYGGVIFEDNTTHELIPVTPAARYHIDYLDLNNDGLVKIRKKRSDAIKLLNILAATPNLGSFEICTLNSLKELISESIPPIPSVPADLVSRIIS